MTIALGVALAALVAVGAWLAYRLSRRDSLYANHRPSAPTSTTSAAPNSVVMAPPVRPRDPASLRQARRWIGEESSRRVKRS